MIWGGEKRREFGYVIGVVRKNLVKSWMWLEKVVKMLKVFIEVVGK